jgi:hypothetical protein
MRELERCWSSTLFRDEFVESTETRTPGPEKGLVDRDRRCERTRSTGLVDAPRKLPRWLPLLLFLWLARLLRYVPPKNESATESRVAKLGAADPEKDSFGKLNGLLWVISVGVDGGSVAADTEKDCVETRFSSGWVDPMIVLLPEPDDDPAFALRANEKGLKGFGTVPC